MDVINLVEWRSKRELKMSTQALVTTDTSKQDLSQLMERVLMAGDLSKMEAKDRITYYLKTCESLGMNYLTKPFDLITLNGKMVLYPNRCGTDQLRKLGNVDIKIIDKRFNRDTGCYEVVAQAKLPNGRTDEDMGIVFCSHLKGDALANAQLKAMTKAKRRVTLSIAGLGYIDESEVNSVKGQLHKMNLETGEIIDVGPTKPDNGKPIEKEVESEINSEPKEKSPRDLLYSELMPLIAEWRKKFTDRKFSDLLIQHFGHADSSKMSLEQLETILKMVRTDVRGENYVAKIIPKGNPMEAAMEALNNVQGQSTGLTDEQRRKLFAVMRDCSVNEKGLKEEIYKRWSLSSLMELNSDQLEEIITWMKSLNPQPAQPNWEDSVAESYEFVK